MRYAVLACMDEPLGGGADREEGKCWRWQRLEGVFIRVKRAEVLLTFGLVGPFLGFFLPLLSARPHGVEGAGAN